MNSFLVFISLVLYASVDAIGFHGFHFKGLEEPKWIGARSINAKWIEQPLDHFNHRDNRSWKMRYYEENEYFNNSGPIFIMLGGEWEISPGFLQTGLMHNLAKQHGALMFYTEHRYYGISKPTQNMATDNLQFLNVDQALADVAYFIDYQKSQKNIRESKVVVFGGSYAGNMATWIRIKYPHLVQGAVASSAPVYAKADFYEYYEVVTNSLKRYKPECATDVKLAFDNVEKLVTSEGGAQKMKEIFNLCETPNVKSSRVTGYFMNYLAEVFASAVQYNKVANDSSHISQLCDRMMNSSLGEPEYRLADLLKSGTDCVDLTYAKFVEELKDPSWGKNIMRQWYFQTCTEFGYYQTAKSNGSSFGTMFDLDFYVNVCTDVFGDFYEKSTLDHGVNRTNIVYGGGIPDVKNVVFVNGDVDPWHALSILEDLNKASPAILIEGSSHCQDLQADKPDDVPGLREARRRIGVLVSKWLRK